MIKADSLQGSSMWYSENQRLGMKKCSNKAYLLEVWGSSLSSLTAPIFMLCLIALPIVSYFYGWEWMFFISIPILQFIISALLRGYSHSILEEKKFKYDYESDSVWIDTEKIL